jgi:hypothetical protein
MFSLKYYGGFSLYESYNLPVTIRNWFVKRLIKQLQDEEEAVKKSQHNSPKR